MNYLKRYLSTLFVLLIIVCSTNSQELTIKSFKLVESDLSAQTQPRKDLNDKNCALVKVGIGLQNVQFEGNIVGNVQNKIGEYWAYMPQGSRQLKLHTQSYLPVMVTFSDYGIEKLESNRTYICTIIKPNGYSEPVDAGGNFYVLNVQPKNAVVFIDGTLQGSSSDGEYSAMLSYGNHTYKVEAVGYISKSGSFTVSSGDMLPINVSLLSAMATITVTCPTPAVSLYVDKKYVGIFPWTGNLKEGMHLIEARKENYHSQQKAIQLSQQQSLDVAFDELIAVQGNLSVNYKPFGADIYVDGKKLGQSPRVFNGLVVGNHQVEIRKAGYTTDSKSVTITEGQTASIAGTLDEEGKLDGNTNLVNQSSLTSNSNDISIPVKDGVSIEMVKVEAGTFMMGATPEMKNVWNDDKPVHQVTLSNDYYIGKYEVTQALWKAVMGTNPSKFKGDNLPVENVSWFDCQEFIGKLNSITGMSFRLPTEAEWEFAARGGEKSSGYQYSGSENLENVAWYVENSKDKTHSVGTKQANELGIYDMSGNVWEWCQDWYSNYQSASQIDPTGPMTGISRVYRGGCWVNGEMFCCLSNRVPKKPDVHLRTIGFRIVISKYEFLRRMRKKTLKEALKEAASEGAPRFGLG